MARIKIEDLPQDLEFSKKEMEKATGGAVGFQAPGFQAPGFQAPGFQAPGFQAPGFRGTVVGTYYTMISSMSNEDD